MAPSDDRDPPLNDDNNPFVAFRRYADETVASVLQGLVGLPSAFEAQSNKGKWLPFDEQSRRKTMETWGASPQEQGTWNKDSQRTTGFPFSSEDHKNTPSANDPTDYEGRRCPYRPADEAPQPSDVPQVRRHTKQEEAESRVSQLLRGIIHCHSFQLDDGYHPFCLEDDYGDRFPWTDAFVDLIDTDTPSKCPDRGDDFHAVDPGPLVALGPSQQLKLLMKYPSSQRAKAWVEDTKDLASKAPENDQENNETELDMYERALTSGLDRKKLQLSTKEPSDNEPSDNFKGRLGIVSSLLSTELVSLPDGTTHTKIVLRKRFADGRVEHNESVHTQNAGAEQDDLQRQDKTAQEGSVERLDEKADNKKGWFWS